MSTARLIDLTGQRFGRLQVGERVASGESRHAQWRCQCACGDSIIARGDRLRTGHITSCGCERRQNAATTLGGFLVSLRLRRGLTQRAVAQFAHLDPSHLGRLELDRRPPAHREYIDELARVLCDTSQERSHLLALAGYAPQLVDVAGGWDEGAERYFQALASPWVTEEDKTHLRQIVAWTAGRFLLAEAYGRQVALVCSAAPEQAS